MRPGKPTVLVIITIIAFIAMVAYILPIIAKINTGLNAYQTQVANRNDYQLHTSPLPKSVTDDLCLKVIVDAPSEYCQPNAVVYAPELFEVIKAYFRNLPTKERTYANVQDRLGAYLDYCEQPNAKGQYRCRYDLRGDDVYPIFFYFDNEGSYYEIIASGGGS
jgi:hypothetical protein